MGESRDRSRAYDGAVDETRYRRAFEIADELSVHDSGCVCPRCAGRLPYLLVELSAAMREAARHPA